MEELLGESLGIKKTGILHIAASESKVNELDELVEIAANHNEQYEWISNEKAEQMTPWLNASTALKIAFMPNEAYCDPFLLGTFFARSAKLLGAEIRQNIEVSDIVMEGYTVKGVVTNNGIIEADAVIIASGAWAPVLAKKAGINLSMAPVRSQYWITEKNESFPENFPMVVLPDVNAYLRPEGGALLFGIREKNSMVVSPKDIPDDISHFLFSNDKGMNDLSEVIDRLSVFFPSVNDIGLKYYIAGFSAYTPDNYLSMGTTPFAHNILFATGCVGAGIAVSGGVGLAFAEMAAGKRNPYDFSAFQIHRFGRIDSFSEEWLQRCAAARSLKNSG